jgi:hypothetical protein
MVAAKGLLETWLPEEFQQIHNERAGKKYPLGDMPVIVLGARRANPGDFAPRRLSSTIWPVYPGTAGWWSMQKAVIIFSGTIRH